MLSLTTRCNIVASIGGAVYGIDTGIIATTIAQPAFDPYFFGQEGSDGPLLGGIVSIYPSGAAIGAYMSGWLCDRFSRLRTIQLSVLLTVLGVILQIAAVNPAMLIVGRLFTGLSSGTILPSISIYINELSLPHNRAIMTGLQGEMIAVGFAIANWIGYAGSFAHGKEAPFRIPLAMQMPATLLLGLGTLFLPFTPRWLASKGRHEEAKKELQRLHHAQGPEFCESELAEIQQQIEYEKEMRRRTSFIDIFSKTYRLRTFLCVFVHIMPALLGAQVVQNFQSKFYELLGYEGQQVLLISAIYGLMGVMFVGNTIYLAGIADRWGRRMTLLLGTVIVVGSLVITAALSAKYGTQDNTNQAAASAAVAFIFIYSLLFAVFFNPTVWLIPTEIMPQHIRGQAAGFAYFWNNVLNIALTQITPVAMDTIGWKYYLVYICCGVGSMPIYYFWLPETKGKSLEVVGSLFGDDNVVELVNEPTSHLKPGEKTAHVDEAV